MSYLRVSRGGNGAEGAEGEALRGLGITFAGDLYEWDLWMAFRYERPPLIEALCDITFVPDQPWDVTIPGLFYAQVRQDLPDKHESKILPAESEGKQTGSDQLVESRAIFRNRDRSVIAQLGPNQLITNVLSPYPGWPGFKNLVLKHIGFYVDVAIPKGVERVQLRYINRIDLPSDVQEPVPVATYLRVHPRFPVSILKGEPIRGFIERVDWLSNLGLMAIQAATALPQSDQFNSALILDIELTTTPEGGMPIADVDGWLEKAHQEIEDVFKACITPDAEALFGERLEG